MGDTRIENGIRQNGKIAQRALLGLVFLLIVGCESRSVWDQRFRESLSLSAPSFSVSPPNPEEFSFAMVGDLHVGGTEVSRFRKILETAQAEGDLFVILLGDISDKGQLESFQAVQNALKDFGFENKAIPILGNHDVFGEGWMEYQKIWGASHYSVEAGNSRFIALDSADGTLGEDQFDWVVSELNRPALSHTFILSHYMPVVPGQRTYLRLSNQLEAERLMSLAFKKGVAGVFGGHYHSFCYGNILGVDYVVAGGGGERRMKPVDDYFFVQVNVSATNVQYQLRPVP